MASRDTVTDFLLDHGGTSVLVLQLLKNSFTASFLDESFCAIAPSSAVNFLNESSCVVAHSSAANFLNDSSCAIAHSSMEETISTKWMISLF